MYSVYIPVQLEQVYWGRRVSIFNLTSNEQIFPKLKPLEIISPSEGKILVAIARKEKRTFYELLVKDEIASKATIIKALKTLTEKEYINAEHESEGRKRTFYRISEPGLYVAMASNEFWVIPDIFNDVIENHIERFPKLLGKLVHFKSNEIVFKEILYRLRYSSRSYLDTVVTPQSAFVDRILKSTFKSGYTIETSDEKRLESLITFLNIVTNISNLESIAEEIMNYPDDNGNHSELNMLDITSDARDAVFESILGLKSIFTIRKTLLPFELGLFLTAMQDQELRRFILNYFTRAERDFRLGLRRISWWITVLEKARAPVTTERSLR
jgi:DNA-binding MarR family transcriptional regulator